jgi:enoyl-CoA hydratase
MGQGRGRIGLPELAVGVPFPASAVELLRSVSGSARLQELLYFGRTYEPDDALTHGLIDEVVPPDSLLERATSIARDLAARPGDSFRITKNYIRGPAADRIRAAEEDAVSLLDAWASPETLASVRTYLEKTLKR